MASGTWRGMVAVAVVGLLLPLAGTAAPLTVLGSLAITRGDGSPLAVELTGFAVIANPGLEKTMVQPIPPFTFPVFVDAEVSGGGGGGGGGAPNFLRRNFDTNLVLTNTTAGPLPLLLTLRRADGSPLGSVARTLAAHETVLLSVADLLP